MASKYYVLMEKQDGHWCQGFGNYDESVVKDELQDKRDCGVKVKDLHILTVNSDTQAAIYAAINKFRSKQSASVAA